MKKIFSIFLILISSHHLMAADSVYEQMTEECRANSANFKYKLWTQAYQQGLLTTLKLFSLSTDSVSTNIQTKGLSPFVFNMLNQPEITQVLSGCMPEAEHFAFIRNLLITESVGKIVGISAGTAAFVGLGKLSAQALKYGLMPVARFSPALAQRLTVATPVVLAGVGIYGIKKNYDNDEAVAKKNGEQLMAQFSEKIQNIRDQSGQMNDSKADLQFDISIQTAEQKYSRKLTADEIKMFCNVIPAALNRCSK